MEHDPVKTLKKESVVPLFGTSCICHYHPSPPVLIKSMFIPVVGGFKQGEDKVVVPRREVI
jgi:hypothetical protein